MVCPSQEHKLFLENELWGTLGEIQGNIPKCPASGKPVPG